MPNEEGLRGTPGKHAQAKPQYLLGGSICHLQLLSLLRLQPMALPRTSKPPAAHENQSILRIPKHEAQRTPHPATFAPCERPLSKPLEASAAEAWGIGERIPRSFLSSPRTQHFQHVMFM